MIWGLIFCGSIGYILGGAVGVAWGFIVAMLMEMVWG